MNYFFVMIPFKFKVLVQQISASLIPRLPDKPGNEAKYLCADIMMQDNIQKQPQL